MPEYLSRKAPAAGWAARAASRKPPSPDPITWGPVASSPARDHRRAETNGDSLSPALETNRMARDLFDLTGKVVLATGANSGLGLGFLQGCARHGADVVVWGRRADKNAQ